MSKQLVVYVCGDCGVQILNQGIVSTCDYCSSNNIFSRDYPLDSDYKTIRSFSEQKREMEGYIEKLRQEGRYPKDRKIGG